MVMLMRKITAQIQRHWLKEIVAGRKAVEYRELKLYWTRRLAGVKPPFLLRLINGMTKNRPEVTVVVRKVVKNVRGRRYALHLGKVVETKNWDR